MNLSLRMLLFVAVCGGQFSYTTELQRVPIEDFARTPEMTNVQLSPDGRTIAYLREFNGRNHMCVAAIGSQNTARFLIGEASAWGTRVPKEVHAFRWINDRRLVMTTTVWDSLYGVAAVDSDGGNFVGISGYEQDPTGRFAIHAAETIHAFDDDEGRILMLDRRDSSGSRRFFPHVRKIDTNTGHGSTVEENPGNVVSWSVDHEGIVRLGIVREEDESKVIYRENAGAEWRTLPLPSRGHDKLRALGFDPNAGAFFVSGFNAEDRWTIFSYDLEQGKTDDAVLGDPEYDIIPDGRPPSVAGVPLVRMVFSEAEQALVGVTYVRDAPRVKWFDDEFRKFQAQLDKALPQTINLLVGQSRDDRKLLVFSFSDTDPGTYFLFDRDKRSFGKVGTRMPWIKPAQMGHTLSIKYTSRDGLTIHGYLTVPAGHEHRNLPLVVMPHGGPWVRDVWGFDPLVQLVASRGYGVLQMNYRGSPGYGSAFGLKGKREVGRGIQNDIEDATRWAIAAGIADPARIAILGGSYGGYSALFALAKSPDLYRCGISFAGVTDWLAIFKRGLTHDEYKFARKTWAERIGDPDEDEEFLESISPVNFAAEIKAPVLIMQGKTDRTVPPQQAKAMVNALKKAKRPVDEMFLSGEGHGLHNERTRLEAFKSIAEFLEKHLGPGLPVKPDV